MPNIPHPIGIKVYGVDNDLIGSATVTLTFGTEIKTLYTNSSGEVIFNVANFTASWSVGDTVSITASKTAEGTKTESLTLTSSPQKVNITLAETSDIDYYESEDDRYVFSIVQLRDFQGELINRSNPLPVKVIDSGDYIDLVNNPSTTWCITRSDGQPDYEEVVIRGTTYRRTFTYNSNGILTTRSAWVER